MNAYITYTRTPAHTHADTHTQRLSIFIYQIKIDCIVIRLFTSQVMDSQVDNETLNNLLENDMISLNGGESDIDLLGSDPYTNSREDMRTKKHFSVLEELLASPPIHSSTNSTKSTTSSTINITIPTHTLRHQPTAATLPTSTRPLSPNTSYNVPPSPIHTHPTSTSTAKPKSTPSDIQSERLPFTFHFIPSHPNYISKLKLLCILPNSAPTFTITQNHLSSKS